MLPHMDLAGHLTSRSACHGGRPSTCHELESWPRQPLTIPGWPNVCSFHEERFLVPKHTGDLLAVRFRRLSFMVLASVFAVHCMLHVAWQTWQTWHIGSGGEK